MGKLIIFLTSLASLFQIQEKSLNVKRIFWCVLLMDYFTLQWILIF